MTERLYRGNCLTPEEFKTVVDRFRAKRAAIDGVFTQLPQLAPDRARRMKRFYDDFWKQTDDPRGLEKEIAARLPESQQLGEQEKGVVSRSPRRGFPARAQVPRVS